MRLLLDTHALLWWAADDPALSRTARDAIADAEEVYLSAVSAYEVVLKFSLGRLPGADALVDDFPGLTRSHALKPLAISMEHAAHAGRLPLTHRDPFDRLLIAQAVLEKVTLVSNERLFDSFGVNRLW